MTHKSLHVSELRVPLEALRGLTDTQRYFWYLLGQIYNETLCTRKLISFTTPSARADRRVFRREAEFSQVFFLFRMACSKVHEARVALHSSPISQVLRQDVFPTWRDGEAEFKELNRTLHDAKWLRAFRDSIGFHYPSMKQLLPAITPNDQWGDDLIYLADGGGNMFFAGADAISRAQMFETVNAANGAPPMEELIEDMVALVVTLNDFVGHCLGQFMIPRLVPKYEPKVLGKVLAPHLYDVVAPFWTHQDGTRSSKKKSNNR
ncbi:hypothetical protein HHL11_25580 [Ramlibacter sp. G-1-2-2]|uniref:Uncharacterized protein n=1 Tax=Ramlibacter agri TaxID=2728837 RepID=A0A848HF34_9BURK|nr:hypothetical protein [Ramlibacter agri]NML47143.1 hypothetical protein [Ramlibacter agri]